MAEAAATAAAPARRGLPAGWLQEYGVYVGLVLLIVVNAVLTPNFLSLTSARLQLIQVAPVLLVALGLALVIGTEGIDISVGSLMALASALLPLYLGYGALPAIALALVACALAGAVNGTLVAVVGVQPIVATLALLVGGRGLALVLAGGQLKQVRNDTVLGLGNGELLGLPLPVVMAGVAALVVGFVVRRTTFGRQLVAIGGNRAAASLAGLPVKRVLIGVYAISGLLAAVAGLVVTARLQASDPRAIGELIELEAITAVVVGGTALTGGRVRVLATVAGAVLMQLISAALIANDVPDSIARIVQAAIIVLAVLLQRRAAGS